MAFDNFDPGELNKWIVIIKYEQSGDKDEEGFDSDESERVVIRGCWAKVSDESGTTSIKSGTEFSEAKRRFLIRYTSTEITTDMLVEYGGKAYSIVRPPNTYGDSGRFIEIWTKIREME